MEKGKCGKGTKTLRLAGPVGPSDVYEWGQDVTKTSTPAAAITLPVGYYVMRVDASVENRNQNDADVDCYGLVNGNVWVSGRTLVGPGFGNVTGTSYLHVVQPVQLVGECDYTHLTTDVTATLDITATSVGVIHGSNVFSVG